VKIRILRATAATRGDTGIRLRTVEAPAAMGVATRAAGYAGNSKALRNGCRFRLACSPTSPLPNGGEEVWYFAFNDVVAGSIPARQRCL